jgi:hypothetical protein
MPSIRHIATCCLVCFAFVTACAQPIDDAFRAKVVASAAKMLTERYVFPDVGKQCGEHISKLQSDGAFARIDDAKAFAARLTTELQSISHDKHMRVRAQEPQGEPGAPVNPILRRHRNLEEDARDNFGVAHAAVLDGNIGYLDLTSFPPVELAGPTVVAAMKVLENVDALIIDLRRNGGGNPTTIQLLCSYFFGEKTHLNTLIWREGARRDEFWTLDSISGKRRADLPLFVLTSHRTFSGGEEFAYNLKTRKRAILIGETTGGGANPGGVFMLEPPIGIFIPTGRAVNPVTGDNWEGKGVEPDMQADSASAYAVALGKAGPAAMEYREAADRKIAAASQQVMDKLAEAAELAGGGKREAAAARVARTLDDARSEGLLDEISINDLGYGFLQDRKYDMAVLLFADNVRAYPHSWNVFDSLGEAYMKSGENNLAIQNYRKSLALNPGNEGAKTALKKLGE